jgi:hypothetical protein
MMFWTLEAPSDADLSIVEAADSTNPFASARYARARERLGASLVLFACGDRNRMTGGVVAYLQGERFGRSLEIPSAQSPGDFVGLWDDVLRFSRRRRVVRVDVGSFGARAVSLPSWVVPKTESNRTEWRLSLVEATPASFASNHRRNIGKARTAGVTINISSSLDAAQRHAALMRASMDRRETRGENIPTISDADVRTTHAFLESGAAQAYQAVLAGQVVSSMLVLRAAGGAYYHSAGTSPDGMQVGASIYLVSEIIRDLKDAGLSLFNLGGATEASPGLMRFKQGFGAIPLDLTAGEYALASPLEIKIRKAIGLLSDPSRLRRRLFPSTNLQ